MPTYCYPIVADGLIVSVMVGLDQSATNALVTAGLSVPAPRHGIGMIDTGSNITCVAPHMLHPGQILNITFSSTSTAAGRLPVRLVEISLSILPPAGITGPLLTEPTLVAMELPNAIPDVDVLIGRDFLAHYQFHYDGPKQEFHLVN